MSIFYFEMQGLKEKQKKSEKLGALCHVYAHGKGPCAYTRQRPHVAVTCASHSRLGVSASGFTVRSSSWAHGNEQRHSPRQSSAHGNAIAHGKGCSTTKDLTHGSGCAHDNEIDARQRLYAWQ
jgi:hypothetical protein